VETAPTSEMGTQSHISVTINETESNDKDNPLEAGDLSCIDENSNFPGNYYSLEVAKGEFANVTEFFVAHRGEVLEEFVQNDLDIQSMVLSRSCASLIWIWNDKTRIILITGAFVFKCYILHFISSELIF